MVGVGNVRYPESKLAMALGRLMGFYLVLRRSKTLQCWISKKKSPKLLIISMTIVILIRVELVKVPN